MPVVTRRFVDNAWRRGCDYINLDLDDSVPQHLKAYARSLIKEAIPNVSKGGAEAHTRINHDHVLADLVAYNQRVRAVFAKAVASGTAAVPLDGRMIDVPVDEWAKVVIAMHEACTRRDAEKQAALKRQR